jgi:hypothetical protein
MEKKLWKIQSLWEEHFLNGENKKVEGEIDHLDHFVVQENFRPTSSSAFVYKDKEGEYFGFEEQMLLYRDKPIFVVDNHNKALFAFLALKSFFSAALPVMNIDAHPDNKVSPFDIPPLTEKNIQEYTEKSLVSDFLDIAQRGGLIERYESVVSSTDFLGFIVPERPFILTVDIDIFGEEGEYVPLEKRTRAIAEAWKAADAVVIATSPGFIDQTFAIEIVKILLIASR